MDDYGTIVHRNRQAIAGVAGLLAFILLWLAFGWGFLGGLVAGIVVYAILLVAIGMIGADAHAKPASAGRHVGGAVSTRPGRTGGQGGSTVPPAAAPGVAAGAGAAGGSAAAATAPAVTGTPVGEGVGRAPEAGTDAGLPAADVPARAVGIEDGIRGDGMGGDAAPVPATEPDVVPSAAPPADADELPVSSGTAGDAAGPGGGSEAAGDIGAKPATLSAPRDGQADDLKAIKGVGPKLETLCNSLGFWHFDQIAGWSEAEVDWVDAHLEGFRGRVRRDGWVAQATALASGGAAELSTRQGRGTTSTTPE